MRVAFSAVVLLNHVVCWTFLEKKKHEITKKKSNNFRKKEEEPEFARRNE